MENEKENLKPEEDKKQSEQETSDQETKAEDVIAEKEETAEEPSVTSKETAEEKKDEKKKKKKDLKEELAKKEAEIAAQKDQYLRLMAEYQNYRNRTTEEKKKIYGDAKVDCVKELLGVMDSFERALAAECADENYKKGVELTFGQIQKAFEKLGVTEVEALGKPFDPNVHNAIKQVDDSEYESDMVCEVFQKGFMLGERLIRPAMVAVSV